MDVRGKKAFVIKEKMKRLKEALKVWNKEVFGLVDLNIDKTVKELNAADELIVNGVNDPTTLHSKELVKKFWEQIQTKESLLYQKSRSKWVQEGDSNTRYFHASIKGRRRRNQIVLLKKGDAWIEGVADVKKEVKEHFSKHLSEEWSNRLISAKKQ
jgi:aminoglycoside N3'-acetyltransferase